MIHYLADVHTNKIGEGTTIWQFVLVLDNAVIGKNCNINCHVFIENEVVIGNNVTVKSGVQLWDGITIEDNVFIGPNATFTNDKTPRSKQYQKEFQQIIIKKNASIGAAATILGGIEIGEYAMVGAGALVTKNVAPHSLVIGSPAKAVAWLNNNGTKMKMVGNYFVDDVGTKWLETDDHLVKVSEKGF